MKWEIQHSGIDSSSASSNNEQIVKALLRNRGLSNSAAISEFLNPPHPQELQLRGLGVDKKELGKALGRIRKAITSGEPIVVYGDYDADGICSTAIVWELLRDEGAKALPFIPQREKEGYGLSKEGIDSILGDEKYGLSGQGGKRGLVITVDSGIVAHEAVEYASTKAIDTIIIDHHEEGESLPKAHAIVHTIRLCAAGISYLFAKEFFGDDKDRSDKALELSAIATITDLVPLLSANRSIAKHGLELLNRTNRPGLRALFAAAGIGQKIGTYEIGFMIGPRINASGRIENAMTALRLLCTNDFSKALEYAQILDSTNRNRQSMTEEMTLHAIESQRSKVKGQKTTDKIVILEHESYHQGVIGLIAGKLVEEYYLPSIVISRGEVLSKASARSIAGFNIIEAIRAQSDLLLGAGGHPMAAGFTIETTRIEQFRRRISDYALNNLADELLERALRIDLQLSLSDLNLDLLGEIDRFSPFGLGNPEPTFCSEGIVQSLRTVGQEGKHLKMVIGGPFDCIAFGKGKLSGQIKEGDRVSIAYTLALDTYNGRQKLQLKIKDIKHGGASSKDQTVQ